MGKLEPTKDDIALAKKEFVFTATGQSPWVELRGDFNIAVYGFGVASVQLQKTYDGGTTPLNVDVPFISDEPDAGGSEPELGVLYRFDCTSFTSGTAGPGSNGIATRLSQ